MSLFKPKVEKNELDFCGGVRELGTVARRFAGRGEVTDKEQNKELTGVGS